MGFLSCEECGKKYSDKAVVCPNCACPTSINLESRNGNHPKNSADELSGYQSSLSEKSARKHDTSIYVGLTIWILSIISFYTRISRLSADEEKFLAIVSLAFCLLTSILLGWLINKYLVAKLLKVPYPERRIGICILLTFIVQISILIVSVAIFMITYNITGALQFAGSFTENMGSVSLLSSIYVYRMIRHNRVTLILELLKPSR